MHRYRWERDKVGARQTAFYIKQAFAFSTFQHSGIWCVDGVERVFLCLLVSPSTASDADINVQINLNIVLRAVCFARRTFNGSAFVAFGVLNVDVRAAAALLRMVFIRFKQMEIIYK